jgi:hypothetical protein
MPTELPIFPLNTVLFPGGALALRIFERRYLDMVPRCARTGEPFVVCSIIEGGEVGPASFSAIGASARIVDFGRTPDGLLALTARGERRARMSACRVAADGLNLGDAEWLPEAPRRALEARDRPLARLALRPMEERGPPFPELAADTEEAGWVSARLAELLPLNLAQRQVLLELDDPARRLDLLRPLVAALGPG